MIFGKEEGEGERRRAGEEVERRGERRGGGEGDNLVKGREKGIVC